jgi:uncharacterized membrane protein
MIIAALVGAGPLARAVITAGAADDPIINTDGIVAAITKFVVPILLAALGVIFISRAGKGEMSRVLTSSAIAIIGLAFIAGAGALFLFGEKLVKLIFG